jgi:Cys-tRNA(Pro) deacylase
MKEKHPTTPAIRLLREKGIPFLLKPYPYEEKGGTAVAARMLGVDEHQVIKTLVMEDERGQPLLVLMHGDQSVSTKNLSRTLGVKGVRPCDPAVAERHTGYLVGGTSPFGTRKKLRVYMEESIGNLTRIYVNAGRRGLLAELSPADLQEILSPIPVHVAI